MAKAARPITDNGNNFEPPNKGPLVASAGDFEDHALRSGKPIAENLDFGIAGDNLGGRNRNDHEDYHRRGMFSEVISNIAKEIGAGLRTDGWFDLRSVVENAPNKRITTSHGEIYITEDGILIIIDSRLQKDHAGRGERAVYARNSAKPPR